MLTSVFLGSVAAIAEECTPLSNGVVLSKYYLSECTACKMVGPVIDEIKSRLQRNNVEVKVREVECTECECPGITAFPTIIITKNKKVVDNIVGYKNYDVLSRWLVEKLKLSEGIFEKQRKYKEKGVTELKKEDFLGGFDGQWLILFYQSKGDDVRKIVHDIAKEEELGVRFGEVTKEEAIDVKNRFNIIEYPYVVAINHGTVVPYSGELVKEDIRKFAERLGKRSFESITYSQLMNKAERLKNGEPIYIVLYKNYEVASHYYNELAQQFKFKAIIYKSNDPAMFEAVGLIPEDADKEGEETPAKHSKMVQLVVYKNGTFHVGPSNLENGSEIIQWIFHTHFRHVTRISNENFYSVFHGIKPVLLLISKGEDLNEQLDNLSADMHLGMPYTNIIMASLDVDSYPQFHNTVLPGVEVPGLVIYDPLKKVWYHEKLKLTAETFEQKARGSLEKFFKGTLPVYPQKQSRWKFYVLAFWIIGALGMLCLRGYSHRYNKFE